MRDGVGEVGGEDDDAVRVAYQDVAGIDGHAAAGDRGVDLDGVVLDGVQRRGGAGAEDGQRHFGDGAGVSDAAIGDDAGGAAAEQAGHEDVAAAGGPGVAAAIHDQDVARLAGFDGLALGVLGVAEAGHDVDVLTRGDVADGGGGADHVVFVGAEAAHALHEDVAEAALEHLCGERGGADAAQGGQGFRVHGRVLRLA